MSQMQFFTCNQLPGASSIDERKPFPGLTVGSDPCGVLPGHWVAGAVESGLWALVHSLGSELTGLLGSYVVKITWPFVPHTHGGS